MSLSIGIVGLPNVGKSTLFNALTKKSVPAENFPFCTIDPSVGVVAVPDNRLTRLSRLSNSEKTISAVIEFVDIAGLVKGAAEGEGLGNQFLSNIREVDAIAEVVRIFDDTDITHVHGEVDPVRDIEVINLELMMADLQTVSKRQGSVAKDVKRNDKDAIFKDAVLTKLSQGLEGGKLANQLELSKEELEVVKGLHLLTMKPVLYVLNKKNGAFNFDDENDERFNKLVELLQSIGAKYVIVDVGVEHELRDVSGEDKETFRREFGVVEDGVDNLIRVGYELLGLITFFTTGEKETRAWTIKKDWIAPEAGAAIHSDFRDKFIRADVIEWGRLLSAGSYVKAKENGELKTVGKDYIVKDGDVIEFRI
ncbi:MAG: redox-regulated ATPase YchF [Candidatus Pacebacteria bacterium]|jgi:hypothetical protein|nr:redox-regulated ATPase YchF [bacterium]MDP6527788.1 redox-regulated ATPase YchF [Candidatus Paceibacterota bacterium]MDP6659625.1 redox-regulated ATPase YchF [Candidatus Paceibacterota bacterium]|tara:strand:- start:53303 stop:54400 length:1098 start_codon:yes stop_codon:yes gene_type:complete